MLRTIILATLIICGQASAQVGGTSPPDPYLIQPIPSPNGLANQNTKAVSLRSQTVDPIKKNLIIIGPGQSNIGNVAPSAYSPANPSSLDQLNVYDGAIYAAADPALGNTSLGANVGYPLLRLADAYVSSGKFDRVILVPIAVNGTLVSDWETGFCAQRIIVAIRRLAQRGIVEGGSGVTIAVYWAQGESDNTAGTSQSAYTNSLNNVIAASRAAGLATSRWFVAVETYIDGSSSAAIQAAQAAVVNHGANVWAGPNNDVLIGSVCSGQPCRRPDLTHWTDDGSASTASAGQTAMALSGAPF